MFGDGIMKIKWNDFDYYDSIALSGIQNNHKKKFAPSSRERKKFRIKYFKICARQ